MAKFYVQSGSFRGIVDSYDAECAAVWAVHSVMASESSRSPIAQNGQPDLFDDAPIAANAGSANAEAADIGLFRLGDEIGISERGFRRKDRVRIPTKHAFLRWIQLMHSIDALQDKMDEACSDWTC